MTKADSLELQMLGLINAERAKAGAGPLKLELNLNQAAEDHSEWMLAVDKFSHTGAGSSNPGTRMSNAGFDFSGSYSWGENIAGRTIRLPSGFSDEVQGLHNQLMNSTGHRENLLNASFDYIGIGIEIGEYKGATWAFVTQNFARTSGDVDLDPGGSGGSGPSNDGNDRLASGPGPDFLDGGEGTDRVEYSGASRKVRADLQNPESNTGDAKGDTYSSIENLLGSRYSDVLAGGRRHQQSLGSEWQRSADWSRRKRPASGRQWK